MPKLIIFPHAIRNEPIYEDVATGSAREIVEQARGRLYHGGEPIVILNDLKLTSLNVEVGEEDTLVVRAVPAGGSDSNANWAKAGGGLLFAGGLAVDILFGWTGIGGVIGTGMMMIGGAAFVGGVAVNYVLGVLQKTTSQTQDPTNPSIRGAQNQFTPYQSIPVILGKTLMVPQYAAGPYTEVEGGAQYLNLLFSLGYSPVSVVAGSEQIGDNPLTTFAGSYTGGLVEGATNSSRTIAEQTVNISVVQATPVTRVTAMNIDEISVDVICPAGVYGVNSSDGSKTSTSVQVQVDYRQTGTSGSWLPVGTINISASTTSQIFGNAKLAVANIAATYDVRVTRVTGDSDSTHVYNTYFGTLRSVVYKDPLSTSVKSVISRYFLRIKATDNLNGMVSNFNLVLQSKGGVYSGSGSGAAQWTTVAATSNPAALYLWCLIGPANPRPVAASQIDYPALEAWFTWCASNNYECNGVFTGGALTDVLQKIAATGRASPAFRDGLFSIVHDTTRSTPVQMFTPRNSWGFTGSKAFSDLPHALRVQFTDAANSYKKNERIVYSDGYGPPAPGTGLGYVGQTTDGNGNACTSCLLATKLQVFPLDMVTSSDQAYKLGRYQIAQALLRPEIFSFSVDVEHIRCNRGDLVLFQHDVPLLGIASGRIKTVTLDGSLNALSATFDEVMHMDAGNSYVVRIIRRLDGSIIYAPVTTVIGDNLSLTFSPAITAANAPAAGDLVSFGLATLETIPVLISSITMEDDLRATIEAVNYNANVYLADSQAIPAFNSAMTTSSTIQTLPPTPVFTGARSDPSVWLAGANGPRVPQILVTWAPGSGIVSADHYDFWYRKSAIGSDWTRVELKKDVTQYSIPNVEPVAYSYQLRTVGVDGSPSAWVTGSITVTANADAPTVVSPGETDLVALYSFDDLADMPFTVQTDQGDTGYNVVGGTMASGLFSRSVAGTGWGASKLSSKYPIGPGSRASGTVLTGQTVYSQMVGLILAGVTFTDFTSGYMCYNGAGSFKVYELGALVFTGGAVSANDVLSVVYDGWNLLYQQNGVTKYTNSTVGPGKLWNLGIDLYDYGTSLSAVSFTTDGLAYFQDAWATVDGWTGSSLSLSTANGILTTVGSGSIYKSIAGIPTGKPLYLRVRNRGSVSTNLFIDVNVSNHTNTFTVPPDRAWYTIGLASSWSGGSGTVFLNIISATTLDFDWIYIGTGYEQSVTDTSRNASKMFLQSAVPTVGKTGKGVDFGGVGYGRVQLPSGSKAISIWFRIPSSYGGSSVAILAGGNGSTLSNYWSLFCGGSNKFNLDVYSVASSNIVSWRIAGPGTTYQDDKWHNIVIGLSGGGSTGIWIDGVRIPTTSLIWSAGGDTTDISGPITSGLSNIGATADLTQKYPVAIDEFRAYQRALTDAEVLYLFANPGVQTAVSVQGALAAATSAQASADSANQVLSNITSDNVLSQGEKGDVILDKTNILAEQPGIEAQATALSITAEKTAYDNAVSALTTYLATLTTPVLWSDLTGNTSIDGPTFRAAFALVYSTRQTLLNKISAVLQANTAAAQSTANSKTSPTDIVTYAPKYLGTATSDPGSANLGDWYYNSTTTFVRKQTAIGTWANDSDQSHLAAAFPDILTIEGSNLGGMTAAISIIANIVSKAVFAQSVTALALEFVNSLSSTKSAAYNPGDNRVLMGQDANAVFSLLFQTLMGVNGSTKIWGETFRVSGGLLTSKMKLIGDEYVAGRSFSNFGLNWNPANDTDTNSFGVTGMLGVAYGNGLLLYLRCNGSTTANVYQSTDYGLTTLATARLTWTVPAGWARAACFGNGVFLFGIDNLVYQSNGTAAPTLVFSMGAGVFVATLEWTGTYFLINGQYASLTGNSGTWFTLTSVVGNGNGNVQKNGIMDATHTIAVLGGTSIRICDIVANSLTTVGTAPAAIVSIFSVAYINGVLFVSGLTSGSAWVMYKSTDLGATSGNWSAVTMPATPSFCYLRGYDGFILASIDYFKHFYSRDQGSTWTALPFTASGSVYDEMPAAVMIDNGADVKRLLLFTSRSPNPYYYQALFTDWLQSGAGIVEVGVNANGTYRKFSDGTLMQWGAVSATANSAWSWVFPVAFLAKDFRFTASGRTRSGFLAYLTVDDQSGRSLTQVTGYCASTLGSGGPDIYDGVVIGRWK